MTVTRRIEEGLLVLDVGEETSYDELEEHFRGGFADPEFVPAAGALLLINETRFTPSFEETRKAAQVLIELGQATHVRYAFVATNVVHYGLCRMLQAYCDLVGVTLRVFTEQRAARAWLKER